MQLKKHLMTSALVATTILAGFSAANAATADGTFDVKLTITSFCSVDSSSGVQDINFGSYTANTGPTGITEQSSASNISVTCSKDAPYVVNLTPSNNNASGAGAMTGPGSDTISYQLSKTAGGSAWGNNGTLSAEGDGVSGTGAGLSAAADTYTVYAKVTSTTDVEPGDYSDTVAVSVLY